MNMFYTFPIKKNMGAQGDRLPENGKWVNDMNMLSHTDKGLYGPQSDNDYHPNARI